MPTVTERFLAAIRRSGLTKAELAQRTGLSRGQISDIVNRKRSPTLETVDRIAAVIGWPEQAGEFLVCDISKSSSIVVRSHWQWPRPPEGLIDTNPDLHAEWFIAVKYGSDAYMPGAGLRWKQITHRMGRDEASKTVERLMAETTSQSD